MEIGTIGLYLAKSVFQGHGVDAAGEVVVRKNCGAQASIAPSSRMLDRLPDRAVMLSAASILPVALVGMTVASTYPVILLLWMATGFAYASAQTPSGRLLRRSSNDENRPALFAAHFAASHACWLLCYPLAGWMGSIAGLQVAALALAAIAALGVLVAFVVWPSADVDEIEHEHPELAREHPHLREHSPKGRHRHAFIIDDHHLRWPR